MAHDALPTNFVVDDPVRASWMNDIGEADADLTTRVEDLETSASDHESRIDALEGNGPATARIYAETVTLTDAQIKALVSTPITLVAAPGAGQRLILHHADLFGSFPGGAYTNINATDSYLVLALGGIEYSSYLATNAAQSLTNLNAFLGTQGYTHATLVNWSPTNVAYGAIAYGESAAGSLVNAALTLTASNSGSGNFTGGHGFLNALQITVYYSKVTTIVSTAMPFRQPTWPLPERRRRSQQLITWLGGGSGSGFAS